MASAEMPGSKRGLKGTFLALIMRACEKTMSHAVEGSPLDGEPPRQADIVAVDARDMLAAGLRQQGRRSGSDTG